MVARRARDARVRENGGRIIMRERATCMVAEPLDTLADAGLVDTEVQLTDLVETIQRGLD